MEIFIPSMGRADERVLRGPAAQLSERWHTTYIVPPAEVGAYAVALSGYGVPASVLACPETGIAATRRWIGERARAGGHSKFCMMDDDIGFLVRRAEDTWRLRSPEPHESDQMMQWIADRLETHQHVGISAREGNNNVGVGTVESLVLENTRTLRLLAYQTEAFLECEHGRVGVMEDFDVNLQILRAGGSNIVSYWWAQGQRMTNEDGGCSQYRTHEFHESSAHRLAELHPGIVQLRQKKNKTDSEGFGTRTEVTIQWKIAWREGQRRGEEARSMA